MLKIEMYVFQSYINMTLTIIININRFSKMKVVVIIFGIVLVHVLGGTEVKANDVFSFRRLSSAENLIEESYGLCPNNKTKCNSSGTCCKTKHNSYHCCRYKNAVCCPDKFHCCPHGSRCNTRTKRCDRHEETEKKVDTIEWKMEVDQDQIMMKLSKSHHVEDLSGEMGSFNDIDKHSIKGESMCPNNKTKCKDTKTCCITNHGNYYCCPHKNAVCCSDKWTCCPEGNTCDLKNKKCQSSKVEKPQILKSNDIDSNELQPAIVVGSVIERFFSMIKKLTRECGNTQYKCTGQKKCCAMAAGKYGCCSYRKGVCCPDFNTCCPHDTTCDVKNKVCTAVPVALIPIKKTVEEPLGSCPDNITTCTPGETCCSVGKVLYGCCPMKDATCCSDKLTCCPHNQKCDIKQKRCVKKDEGINEEARPIKPVTQRKSLEIFLSKVGLKSVCPDQSRCPGRDTCCSIGGGRFGCCPYALATCCPDLQTCCPHGTSCVNGGCM